MRQKRVNYVLKKWIFKKKTFHKVFFCKINTFCVKHYSADFNNIVNTF